MKLYALTCGLVRGRKSVFVPDASKDKFIEGPMPAFLVIHPQGNVLFDTGPHPSVFRDPFSRWGGLAKAFQPLGDEKSGILDQLESTGYKPDDIRYVVNSHLHFDHAGGNQFFPKSVFLVSRKEMESARNQEHEGQGYFRADWDHPLIYREIEGQFDIYGDGSLILIPLPGHTPGHQGLLVRLAKQGAVVLSGDSAPCQENFLHSQVSRNNLDDEQAGRSIQKLHEWVQMERALLIHGHDPDQWGKIKKPPDFYE